MDSYFVLVRTRQHDKAPGERVSLVIKDPAEYRVSSVEYREQAIWLFRVVTSPPPEYCQDEPGD